MFFFITKMFDKHFFCLKENIISETAHIFVVQRDEYNCMCSMFIKHDIISINVFAYVFISNLYKSFQWIIKKNKCMHHFSRNNFTSCLQYSLSFAYLNYKKICEHQCSSEINELVLLIKKLFLDFKRIF